MCLSHGIAYISRYMVYRRNISLRFLNRFKIWRKCSSRYVRTGFAWRQAWDGPTHKINLIISGEYLATLFYMDFHNNNEIHFLSRGPHIPVYSPHISVLGPDIFVSGPHEYIRPQGFLPLACPSCLCACSSSHTRAALTKERERRVYAYGTPFSCFIIVLIDLLPTSRLILTAVFFIVKQDRTCLQSWKEPHFSSCGCMCVYYRTTLLRSENLMDLSAFLPFWRFLLRFFIFKDGVHILRISRYGGLLFIDYLGVLYI